MDIAKAIYASLMEQRDSLLYVDDMSMAGNPPLSSVCVDGNLDLQKMARAIEKVLEGDL